MKNQIDVTAAIIVKDDRVFAARRKAGLHLAGFWEFPGGKLEEGETAEGCLSRELREELNINTRIGAYVGESLHDYGTKIVRLMAYQVEHVSGDFKLSDHDEMRWLAVDELESVEWAPADIPLVKEYQSIARTREYYANNAQAYCEETRGFQVAELYRPFLMEIPKNAHILDLGCGSGRDSKAFLDQGYNVTSVDGSPEIAACAEQFLGRPVDVATFQELAYCNTFDGVWASASLLHSPRSHFPEVLDRIMRGLKGGGVIYMSFKWGNTDSVDHWGRCFTNFTEYSLRESLEQVPDLDIVRLWTENKVLRGSEQQWVNVLVRKDGQLI